MGHHKRRPSKIVRKKKRRIRPLRSGPSHVLGSADLGSFDRRLDQLVVEPFREDPPDVLYHYTTWTGAEGILTTRQFWATAHDCTNDPAELTSADSVILEVASELETTVEEPARGLIRLLLKNYSRSKVTEIAPVYLACFSEARDQGGQWEAYADKGRGVCLGVRILDEEIPDPSVVGVSLLRVDYSESSWRQKITTGFKAVASEVSQLAVRDGSVQYRARRPALNALYRIAGYAAITAKKPAWSREAEWRQVAVVRRGAKVQIFERKSAGQTIRYLKLFLRRDERPIVFDEIIIGSNQDVALATSRLRAILANAGYPNDHAELPRIATSCLPWISGGTSPIVTVAD